MNIHTEQNENHQALITVELDTAQLERKKQQAAKKLARNAHIPGFRPGKAPYHMVVRHLGEGRILEEAVENLIDEIYPKVLDESGVKPYGPGKLEDLKLEEETPTAQFIVPLAPEVTLGDFQNIRLPYEPPEVTDESVEKAIENIRGMYAQVDKVDRSAEESDLVNIVLTGRLTDAEDGEFYIDHESYPVIIEAESEDTRKEWPFSGFSRNLIGLSTDEKKNISYTYPEDFEENEDDDEDTVSLKGKTVDFEIEVTKVSSRVVPALDEDFIKKIGPYETLEESQNAIRERLIQASEGEYKEEYDERLLAELLKDAELKYPQEAVEDEVNLVLNRLKARLENQGIGFDLYLKTRNITEEQVLDELRPGSEQRLKESLVLMEIASKENIQVDQSEVQHQIQHTLDSLMSGMSEREARRAFNDDVLRGLTANVYNNALIGNTLKHLRAIASGELENQINTSSDGTQEDTPDGVSVNEEEIAVDPSLADALDMQNGDNAVTEEVTSQEVTETAPSQINEEAETGSEENSETDDAVNKDVVEITE